MTAAQPDPYETVRLLPADTFTQQDRDEWIEIAAAAMAERGAGLPSAWRHTAAVAVDALLAHLAAQQTRPMPGGGNQ